MLIGIRREDKNEWEKRTPLVPVHVAELVNQGLQFRVQPSPIRAFPETFYSEAGAEINEDLSPCQVILAVKEIPEEFILPDKVYLFFSHVIKGQPFNMPMLKELLQKNAVLIDYECIVNEQNQRLIFFGRFAGLAGMIDTLWTLGQRILAEGIECELSNVLRAFAYDTLDAAKIHINDIGKTINDVGLPEELIPLTCGLSGYGNVSQGAQEILDLLPVIELSSSDLKAGRFPEDKIRHHIFKTVFQEQDLVLPMNPEETFDLQDYYDNPEKYRSIFDSYVPNLSVLVNCIYWDERYPRLITKSLLRELYKPGLTPKLKVVGDISCDIEGAIECTLQPTTPDSPAYIYDPVSNEIIDGVEGNGPAIMAVDNLPCEFPKESSRQFSDALREYLPEIAKADFTGSFKDCNLPPILKGAVIAYRGALTPNYEYLEKYL